MTQDADSQLVDTIVRKVLAALGVRGGALAPGSSVVADAPAEAVRVAGWSGPARKPAAVSSDEVRTENKVFVTARIIEQRLAGNVGSGGIIALAHNEYLTPNARDLVEMKHLAVRKSPAPLVPAAGDSPPAATPTGAGFGRAGGETLGLLVVRPNDKVAATVRSLGYAGLAMRDFTRSDCWMCDLQTMCDAILSKAIAAGVAILPYAADAMVLANKIRGIRAVQGTRPESIAAAVRRFDANLLILEHVYGTYHEMRNMIRTFARPRTGGPTYRALMDAVGELERK